MPASILAILDLKGKVRHIKMLKTDASADCALQSLIQRTYRDDIPPSAVEQFLPLVIQEEDEGSYAAPCFSHEGISYIHVRHNNLYSALCSRRRACLDGRAHTRATAVLALTKKNSNAMELICFLHKLVSVRLPSMCRRSCARRAHQCASPSQVLTEYFKELEEESIRDNFVIIYELLDEMMDNGEPQVTESKILQEYITQESHRLEVQVRPPMAVTNAVSWRSEGIRYRKNEVFLDVIESVNLLVRARSPCRVQTSR